MRLARRLLRKLALTGLTAVSLGVSAFADSMLSPDYLFNSDPTLHVIGDELWLFTSHDQTSAQFCKGKGWGTMYDYHALSTKDFRTWVDHGSAFSIHDVAWPEANSVWDGDAGIAANGRFYAYAPFDFQIGVLVSDHPAGPYVDALGHPLIGQYNRQGSAAGLVSPSVFWEGETPYLVYGWNALNIARLKPNMIELAEKPVVVKKPPKYVESPIITRVNGKYMLSYSCGGAYGEHGFDKPQIRYSTSDSLYGPYTNSLLLQDIQINPDGQGFLHKHASSAHQGLACYKGQWLLAYQKDSTDGIHRRTCVTKLDLRADGTFGVIDPNTDRGVVDGPINFVLEAFAPYKREAEEFHERQGAEDEQGVRQDYHFKMRDGDWLRYNNMDFGAGARGYRIEVSCENSAVQDAKIEFRLDAVDGPLFAQAAVRPTGGKTDYLILSGPTLKRIGGIHDMFLVAQGKGGNATGQVFNINWFTFTREKFLEPVQPVFAVNCGGEAVDGMSADQAYADGGWGYLPDAPSEIRRYERSFYPSLNLPAASKTLRRAKAADGGFVYRFPLRRGKYDVEIYSCDNPEPTVEQIYMRITRKQNTFIPSFSQDGRNFHEVMSYGKVTNALTKIALAAWTDQGNRPPFDVQFDDLRIEPGVIETFDGPGLDQAWRFIREDVNSWSLTNYPGALNIRAQFGRLIGKGTGTVTNLLVRDAPEGDWQATVRVTFAASGPRQFAGLLAWQDDDNFVDCLVSSHQKQVEGICERDGAPYPKYAYRGPVADNFDIRIGETCEDVGVYQYNEAGNRMRVKRFPGIKVTDGPLDIQFISKSGVARVNAIKIFRVP